MRGRGGIRLALAAALTVAAACGHGAGEGAPPAIAPTEPTSSVSATLDTAPGPREHGPWELPLPSAAPERPGVLAEGLASYYGHELAGRLTANGERYDPEGLTAAHRKLPFGTCLVVTRIEGGRRVVVRVNDRGPYVRGRILDLSLGAARRLGMLADGVARVRLRRCHGKLSARQQRRRP